MSDVISLVSLVIAIGGAVIAFFAFRTSRAALERDRLTDPRTVVPWSPLRATGADSAEVENLTSRRVTVHRVEHYGEPDSRQVHGDANVPVDPADRYRVTILNFYAHSVDRIVIHWSWTGDDEIHEAVRTVPLSEMK